MIDIIYGIKLRSYCTVPFFCTIFLLPYLYKNVLSFKSFKTKIPVFLFKFFIYFVGTVSKNFKIRLDLNNVLLTQTSKKNPIQRNSICIHTKLIKSYLQLKMKGMVVQLNVKNPFRPSLQAKVDFVHRTAV